MDVRTMTLFLVLVPLSCGDDTMADGGGSGGSTGTNTSIDTTETDASSMVDTATETTPASSTASGSSSTSTPDGTSTGEPGEDCIIHVDATSGNDALLGLTWATAKQTLSAGLSLASRYDCEVWVAAGTYTPSEVDDPTESFVLFPGAQVYGGFAGDESSPDERDIETNPTVLSGNIGAPGLDDNTLHVVIGADGARLDGFEITGGYARDPKAGIDGAGLWVTEGSMTVARCTFANNRTGDAPPPEFGTIGVDGGAGAGLRFFGDDLVVEGCSFIGNSTGIGSEGPAIGGGGGPGAGLAFQGSSLVVTDSLFFGNLTGDAAAGGDVGGLGGIGAGLYFLGDELVVQGSSFTGNTSGAGGGAGQAGGSGGSGVGITARGGSIHIEDSDFISNTGGPGGSSGNVGGGGAIGGALSIESNSGGVVVAHCEFQGNTAGDGGDGASLDGGAGIGGAIFLRSDMGEVLVAHNTFFGNSAGTVSGVFAGGGAVAILPSNPGMPQGDTTVVGNIFAGNTGSIGGALFIRSKGAAPVDVVSCAFGNNAANEGSVLFYQSISPEGMAGSTLVDSIVWGNPTMIGNELLTSPGFVGDPVVPLTVSSSIVEGGCTDDTALVCGAGILVTDPLFADPAVGDLHPLGGAGIDQGDDAALPVDALDLDGDGDLAEPWSRDLDDNPRVAGAAVDLGPYEAP